MFRAFLNAQTVLKNNKIKGFEYTHVSAINVKSVFMQTIECNSMISSTDCNSMTVVYLQYRQHWPIQYNH
jgi:hypothetical protein